MSSDTLLYVNASNDIIIIFYLRVSFILHLNFVPRYLQQKKNICHNCFFFLNTLFKNF